MKRILLITAVIQFLFASINGQNWNYSNYIEGNILPQKSIIDENQNVYILSEVFDSVRIGNNWIGLRGGYDLMLNKFDSEGNLEWYQMIGGSKADLAGGLAIVNNDRLIVCGNYKDTVFFETSESLISRGDFDVFLAEYDLDGNLGNYKTVISGSTLQRAYNVFATIDNQIIIAGKFATSITYTESGTDSVYNSALGYGSFIETVNTQFDFTWSSSIESNSNSSVISQISEVDDGYLFSGYYRNSLELDVESLTSTSGSFDVFLYKTNFSGDGQWVRNMGGSNTEAVYSLRTDVYDNSYMLGYYMSSTVTIDSTESTETSIDVNYGGRDIYIFKYNRSGNLLWKLNKGSSADDNYYDMDIQGDVIYSVGLFSNQIIFNNDTLDSSFGQDAFLSAMNPIGDPISGLGINGLDGDENCKIVNADDNLDAYVVGYSESSSFVIGDSTYSAPTGSRNLFFAKYSHPFKAAFTDENLISCQGLSDGMLTVTPYFGVPPYTYSWAKDGTPFVEADSVATGLNAGVYSVSVTDGRDSVTVVQLQLNDPSLITIGFVTDEVSCYNGNDGGIDITASGGNNIYQYNWTGGSGLSPSSEDQTGLTAADYTVTVTDYKGCTASQTITLGQADPMTFGESIVVETLEDANEGSVDLIINGGTEPYSSFLWEGPDNYSSTQQNIENLNGGNYHVTVTDANSCIADTVFLVPNDSLFIGYMSQVTDITCGDLTNGEASVTSNRHEVHSSFNYTWIDLEDSTVIGGNFASITGLDSSRYRVYMIDLVKEDTTSVDFKIEKPQLLVANSIASNPTCSGSDDGFINAIISGGTLPYSYEWNTGSTNEDLSDIVANGTYTLTVTDANGCTATTSEDLDDPDAMYVTIEKTDPLCRDELTGKATANVNGGVFPYNFVWNDPGNQTEQTVTGLGAGTYRVTVTDQNGCVESSNVTLNNPLSISIANVESEDATCYNTDDAWIKISASGGSGSYTYNWGHIDLGTDSVGGIGAGAYTVTVNDVNNCTPVVETININEPTEITVDINTVDNICFEESNGEITVTPSGGSESFDFTWGHTLDNTGALTNLAAGTYYLTLSDGYCPELTYDIPVVEPTELIVSIDTTDISCLNAEDGEIALSTSGGSGSYSYSWSHDVTTDATVPIADAGLYTVTVSDGACPERIYNIPVNEPDLFLVDVDTNVTNCYNIAGGSITVTPSGGSGDYSYTWSHTTDNVNEVIDLTSGNYDVTISDGSCPDITASIYVDQPDPLVFDVDTTDVSCHGYSDGSIAVNVTGGSETYTYTWGHTSSNLSELGGLSQGTYNLTISDGACPDSTLVIPVGEPEEFAVSVDKENVTCNNAMDGTIQVNINGGSENYDVTWSHTTDKVTSLSNLDAGNYNVTVDDGNCPVITESIDLTEPDELKIQGFDSVNISSLNAQDGQLIIHVEGGVEPYRYLITGAQYAQTDSIFNNLDAGVYVVTVNDDNNCGPVYSDTVEFIEPTSGIKNYWEETSITYYPNPADDKVMLKINNIDRETIDLKIVNSMGSLLMNKEIIVPNKTDLIELRTERLAQGIYFILIDNIRLKTPLVIK